MTASTITPFHHRIRGITYSPKEMRSIIAESFPVVDKRLKGLRIFTNRKQTWFEDIPLEDLVRHVPDLRHNDIKTYLLGADPKLHALVNGKIPHAAYQHYGFAVADGNTGIITTVDATPVGYKPLIRD